MTVSLGPADGGRITSLPPPLSPSYLIVGSTLADDAALAGRLPGFGVPPLAADAIAVNGLRWNVDALRFRVSAMGQYHE